MRGTLQASGTLCVLAVDKIRLYNRDMSDKPRLRNPFFPLVALSSTAFAITVLALIVGAVLADPAAPLNRLLDRYGGRILAVEFATIFVTGLLALVLDRRQSAPATPDARPHSLPEGEGSKSIPASATDTSQRTTDN